MSVPTQGSNPSADGLVPQPTGGQVPPSPQAANGQVPSSSDPTTQNQPPKLTPEQLEDALRRVRDEAAGLRQKVAEHDAAKTAAERAKMDEATRLKAEIEDRDKALEKARANARQNALEAAVALKSRELGIVYPDVAMTVVEKQATYGEDDKPQNVDELLRAFMQSHPLLTSAAAASANSSPTNAARPQQGTIMITKAQLNDMRYHEQFKNTYKMNIMDAVSQGVARLE